MMCTRGDLNIRTTTMIIRCSKMSLDSIILLVHAGGDALHSLGSTLLALRQHVPNSSSQLASCSSPNSSIKKCKTFLRNKSHKEDLKASNGNTKRQKKDSFTSTYRARTPFNGTSRWSSILSLVAKRPCLLKVGSRSMIRMERSSIGTRRLA